MAAQRKARRGSARTREREARGRGRGNVHDRRVRHQWLLDTFGNGTTCRCTWCAKRLRKPEADRHPACGHAGGTYRRDNIVPACRQCNASRCARCATATNKARRYSAPSIAARAA
jgi:hypothetical protein